MQKTVCGEGVGTPWKAFITELIFFASPLSPTLTQKSLSFVNLASSFRSHYLRKITLSSLIIPPEYLADCLPMVCQVAHLNPARYGANKQSHFVNWSESSINAGGVDSSLSTCCPTRLEFIMVSTYRQERCPRYHVAFNLM